MYYRDHLVGLSIWLKELSFVDPVFNDDYSFMILRDVKQICRFELVSSVPAVMVAGISIIFCMISQG